MIIRKKNDSISQNKIQVVSFHQNKVSFRSDKGLRIHSFCISDAGERTVNEDSVFTGSYGHGGCFILADGLGGHGMGDEASALAVDVASSSYFEKSEWNEGDVCEVFQAAQDMLLTEHKIKNIAGGMKTTLSFLAITHDKASIGWIGDSRVYWIHTDKAACRKAKRFFRKNKAYGAAPLKKHRKESAVEYFYENGQLRRTSDHSIPQGQYECGEIKEEEIRFHSKRGFLISALGEHWEDDVAAERATKPFEVWKMRRIKAGDAFLLCSDGFWELIDEKHMMSLLLESKSAEEWLNDMKEYVLNEASRHREKAKCDGKDWNMDNYSAIAVWIV